MGLVDTGSTISVIHPSTLSIISREREVPLHGESVRICFLGLVSLDLSFGTCEGLWTHDMVVSEIEVPVIIGVDFFQSHQCTLDVGAGVLSVDGTTHVCWRMEAMPRTFRITVAETVTIPPMSEMIVPGKMEDTPPFTQVIVDSSGRHLCKGNVVLGRVVVNPVKGVLPLRVMNMSNDPQVRFHDTQVGVCEPVSSVSQTLSSSNVPDGQLTLPDHVQKLLDKFQDLLTPDEQVMAEVLLAE